MNYFRVISSEYLRIAPTVCLCKDDILKSLKLFWVFPWFEATIFFLCNLCKSFEQWELWFRSVLWNNCFEYILRNSNPKKSVAELFFTANYLITDVFHYKWIFSKFSKKLFFKTPLGSCFLEVHLGIWKGRELYAISKT